MPPIHDILRRQLRLAFGSESAVPDSLAGFLKLVDATYAEMDADRTFFRQVIDVNPNFIFAKDRDGRFTLINKAVADAYGTSVEDLLGKSDSDFNPNSEEVEHFRRDDLEVIDGGGEKDIPLEQITDAGGNVRWLWTIKKPIQSPDGRNTHVLGVATDITLRVQAERSLMELNARILRNQEALHRLALMDHSDMEAVLRKIALTAADVIACRRVSFWLYNEARTGLACRCLSEGGAVSKPLITLLKADYPLYFAAIEVARTMAVTDARDDPRTSEFRDYLAGPGITSMMDVPIWLNGDMIGVVCNEHVGPPREWTPEEINFSSSIADFVSLALAMERRQQLEVELRQSQKMEAIGHLAGGVAHDFNNLLTAINGEAQLLLRSAGVPERALDRARQILNAGERAANLTRQLLMFSRKQVTAPRVVDLNGIIHDLTPMMERLIGEDFVFKLVLAPVPVTVRIDPGQIDQVLMNLAVNARDAMPGGGQITIETREVRRDPSRGEADRIVITVTDCGCGMDESIRARAFEPFFTTKEAGRGTGLGLSTVYGIIQQNRGRIEVASEPGRGTRFTIELPAEHLPPPLAGAHPISVEGASRGRETILVVEDEPQVRSIVQEVLDMHGYTILDAAGPEEAIAISEAFPGKIHLMLTDVVMPGMNGCDLFDRLRHVRPHMRVLYMSGYTEGVLNRQAQFDPSTDLIQKPFSFENLSARVRMRLDEVQAGMAPAA